MRARLIGVAGPSGSGKSELSHHLGALLGAPVVSLDNYYLDLSHLPLYEREQLNFDIPSSMDEELLLAHCVALSAGTPVAIPHYDFSVHTRNGSSRVLHPADYVIVEGLFTLYWARLRDLLHLKIYVDLEDEVCFDRRLARDVMERGRSEESVRRQYDNTVRPMAERYIWPTRRHADVVVRGDAVLEESGATLQAALRLTETLP